MKQYVPLVVAIFLTMVIFVLVSSGFTKAKGQKRCFGCKGTGKIFGTSADCFYCFGTGVSE